MLKIAALIFDDIFGCVKVVVIPVFIEQDWGLFIEHRTGPPAVREPLGHVIAYVNGDENCKDEHCCFQYEAQCFSRSLLT